MELIDILSPDGTPTRTTCAKAEAHRTGAWHRAAHVWLVTPDRRVLLQRRALAKDNWPGKWDISVAGHVSAGESAIDAAVREAREELGLDLNPSELKHIGTLPEQFVLHGGTYLDNEIHEVFLVRRHIDLSALVLDPDEVAEVALVTVGELAEYDLVPHPAEYALLLSVV